ncbi:mitochondrial import inner membrane translocase subunit TIM14-like [Eptesicus fuscus]|uniref:mitochondrial import inner membrane translocase subunit TIM14-like n=1 Tax=Eptesicus fuscus TaxID=29078 RepID=UPI00240461E6|nr:mitochondrial import inner membrane translocase subunit TIM14-like [Eptesicus fuscus]
MTIAAAGFASCYILQDMKHMEPQANTSFKLRLKRAFSGGCSRGGHYKMTKQEATLILDISSTTNKGKRRDAHRQIMLLNHSYKEASPCVAAKK